MHNAIISLSRAYPATKPGADGFLKATRVLAILSGLVGLLSLRGAIPWAVLQQHIGGPFTILLNPTVGPKTTLLFAGIGALYLAVRAAVWLLSRSWARLIFGSATLGILRHLSSLAWVPIGIVFYALTRLNPSRLVSAFVVQGDAIFLTLPTLVAMLVFAFATLVAARQYPLPHEQPSRIGRADLLAIIITLCAGIALDRMTAEQPRPWSGSFARIFIAQIALVSIAVLFVLMVVGALRTDWAEMRILWSQWRVFGVLGTIRLATRFALFVVPVVLGVWLATGYHLNSASIIQDRTGTLLTVYHPYGAYRFEVRDADISPWAFKAVESIEDPGLGASPATHMPINPVRIGGIFTGAI